jgi:hypothetical protein
MVAIISLIKSVSGGKFYGFLQREGKSPGLPSDRPGLKNQAFGVMLSAPK